MAEALRVAADIGGTFTDIAVITAEGVIASKKVASTPPDYSVGVITGVLHLLDDLGASPSGVAEVLHGCTVASNAILERKGAKTALLTTRGFRDVLELRRIRIPALYNPLYVKPRPLVARDRRFEVTERLDASGAAVIPLDESDVRRAVEIIAKTGVEAVAVSFLHSYLNPAHERRVGEILRAALPGRFVSLSVDVLPEIREYERTSTTVINAYVGPPLRRYLASLVDALQAAGVTGSLRVMQSSGGILDARTAIEKPAQIVECGPAAGVIGAAYVARLAGYENVITFDMGGTTAKASIVEAGSVVRTGEYEVGGGISLSSRLVKGGGYPLKLPVIDVSEVGAGGGSIVWLDKGGAIKVGPMSAGAVPGPACYGLGGPEPTVTDANLVLGYLNPESLAGGAVRLDAAKAHAAIEERVARRVGLDLRDAAYAIHTIAIANMMRAVKAVSTYRGRDPRDFTLLAFGGNGGVHGVRIAEELDITRIVVPPSAGVLSALGLLVSDIELSASHAYLERLERVSPAKMDAMYRSLEDRVVAELGYPAPLTRLSRAADLRYTGQAFELTVALPNGGRNGNRLDELACAFESEHERTYGHRFGGSDPVELVSLRVTGTVALEGRPAIDPTRILEAERARTPREASRRAYFGPSLGFRDVPVLSRVHLAREPRSGPLIVEDYDATTVVPPHCRASLDGFGNIVIDTNSAAKRRAP